MPVIPISSDTPKLEEKIAAAVAERLDYPRLGRELLAVVAEQHQVEEKKLVRALDEPIRFFGMSSRDRIELITYVQAECLERLLADNIVCHGLAAHLFTSGVSHALRVRILAEPGERISSLGLKPGPENQAKIEKMIQSQNEGRRRWSTTVFGIDETDPAHYDMVLNLETMDVEKAVDIICATSEDRKFQAMTYSSKNLQDKLLASRVREKLIHAFPQAHIQANGGNVTVRVHSAKREKDRTQQTVRDLVRMLPGVRFVEVQVISIFSGRYSFGNH
ncbi:MAG: cytidylate kinase-like family protein [Proteobacteria bacterium]|nr:cytidylate kinase-like family protein [Pseudomonadota bacterium]